jgi:DNA mismatch repair protein MutS
LERQQARDHPQAELLFNAPVEKEQDLLAEAMAEINPDELTPKQALDELYRLKKIRDE